MKNMAVYITAAVALVAIAALMMASLRLTSGIAPPSLGAVAYIWIGAVIVLLGIMVFFIWLAKKGK